MQSLLIKTWSNINLVEKFRKTINFFNKLAQVLKVKCTEQSARIQETIEQLKKSISFGMLK
jgi:16S rRNA G527 N7-methylase RsmG